MSTHTPGPWRVESHPENLTIICRHGPSGDGSEDVVVAEIENDLPGQSGANARLIAAAPETAAERDRLKAINAELLEALRGLLKEFVPSHDIFERRAQGRAFDDARAAIANAEGRD